MPSSNYRLAKHFSKPEEGEYVPITFIDLTIETVAWSPKLKQSIYVTPDVPDIAELKRVREVNVLKVINQLSSSVSTIELNNEEKEQFNAIYTEYLEKSGEILFTRKKAGRKTISFFVLSANKTENKQVDVKRTLLSEKFERE
ncbi:MAG: hypothetical protein CVV34_00080 [Methanomicrobiales archaeon HGW-Methanomicrobiales-5]|jgi:hypothetical protein|nr:MAG: hypothetical protein CVV34_00080 [Methanomicrobiales archaeon HGW-Methanomicrobiales-5]